eukprot:CAMPEP_0116922990 /NCGR_PEP_ID=MMETSP0467-20121206/22596_1 /TAXON_ID=283647 /ORGANISM="Mesodinium pulex, Strain SPMC105" /LENGTH=84 /DNA_ID=CAMNT_0004601437 /DNA_START=288 /DNA_END=542 /DNA_ORIENTATION=+
MPMDSANSVNIMVSLDKTHKDFETLVETSSYYTLEYQRKDLRDYMVSNFNIWRTPTILAFKIVCRTNGYEAHILNRGNCIVPII